jgi:D-alanyl-D-alanine-carboxypeptidase/D-alanyl-D-alanine-endopeptidase
MFRRLPRHFALVFAFAFGLLVAPLGCVSSATPGKPPPSSMRASASAATASAVEPLRFDDPARVSRIVSAARAFEPKLIKALEKTRAPGAAIGLVVDGQLVYFKCIGVREVGAADPARLVDEDTVFRIASMTKAFVSAAALRLRDEGLLSLDDPAEKYLPELRGLRYPTADSPRITVRQLLSHASGLPEDNASADLRMPMTEAAFDEMLSHGLTFSNAPGTHFEYANLGFALAGRVVTQVSGVRVQEYVARELLRPLGMTATGWDGSSVPVNHRAHGYGRRDSAMPAEGIGKYQEDDAPHEEPMLADGAWAAIGGLWTSPRDYARWVAFQLAAWPPRDAPDNGPVRRASLRETQSVQRFNGIDAGRDSKGELRVRGGGYGLGWGVSATCRFEQVIAHGGGLPGYGSWVGLYPDRGVAVFTMTNLTYTGGSRAAVELIEALDDQGLIPKRPQPVSPHLEAARARVLSLLAHFDEAEAVRTFDRQYESYETFAAMEKRLSGLRAAHGACTPGTPFEAENALRGHARLACERGGIELVMTLTSDSPARIQSLALKSALPPSARLVSLGGRASALLAGWNEQAAAELFPKTDDRKEAKGAFAAAALDHGACQAPQPDLSDGATSATFRLRCEHGDLNLKINLQPSGAVVSKVDLLPADGGPRCPR